MLTLLPQNTYFWFLDLVTLHFAALLSNFSLSSHFYSLSWWSECRSYSKWHILRSWSKAGLNLFNLKLQLSMSVNILSIVFKLLLSYFWPVLVENCFRSHFIKTFLNLVEILKFPVYWFHYYLGFICLKISKCTKVWIKQPFPVEIIEFIYFLKKKIFLRKLLLYNRPERQVDQ